jgi:hypothetical protein
VVGESGSGVSTIHVSIDAAPNDGALREALVDASA